MWPIINWPATNRLRFVTRKIEFYLEGGAVRGLLKSTHARLSDHLRDPEESFIIDEAVITSYRAKEPIVSDSMALVGKSQILFAVDVEESASPEHMRVDRTAQPVALCVGPFWLRGRVHLPIGGDLRAYFDSNAMSFIPLTAAVVAGREGATPRTLLVNMERISIVAPLTEETAPPSPEQTEPPI